MTTSPNAPSASGSSLRRYLLPAVGVVLILLGIVAVVASRGSSTKDSTSGLQQTQPVSVTGDSLPSYSSAGDDPAVGVTIPTVKGKSFDGTPVTIAPSGGAQLLMFVAHWCPHCQREVPLVSQWLADGGLPDGVRLTTVATGTVPAADNYPPSSWLAKNNWPDPILADDELGTAARAFGLSAYPYFVIVDAQGKVVARQSGEVPVDALSSLVAKVAPS